MKKIQYTQRPEPLLIQHHGEYVHVNVNAHVRETESELGQLWEAESNSFWEKESELDLDAVRAAPEAYLHYVPRATREEGKEQAQLMLDKLRDGYPVIPVPSYREGAAVCSRPSDKINLLAGLQMGGLPYYELADGTIVQLSEADIKAIAIDVAAAETEWQQKKQACWAAIEAADGEDDIAAALAEFAVVLSEYAVNPLTNVMNMDTNNKTSWLVGLLSGWGIRESWAKIIAGSIAGALAAAGFLTSCSACMGI